MHKGDFMVHQERHKLDRVRKLRERDEATSSGGGIMEAQEEEMGQLSPGVVGMSPAGELGVLPATEPGEEMTGHWSPAMDRHNNSNNQQDM